jgi:hypothetical protein
LIKNSEQVMTDPPRFLEHLCIKTGKSISV